MQRQLKAFNARDIDALLAAYAEDAQMFEHPSKSLASGSAAFRERYVAFLVVAAVCAIIVLRSPIIAAIFHGP